MRLSCTVFETLSLIFQNLKRSRDSDRDYAPFRDSLKSVLGLAIINMHTKCEVSILFSAGDVILWRHVMMSFLTLRIWQAYAFEHPQFWQRIDAPAAKGGTEGDFVVFASKIQLLSKEVRYKVSLCKNFQGQCCSYIIHLSNGPKTDCGRRPHLPKICAQASKWPTPSENAEFKRFRWIVPQPWVTLNVNFSVWNLSDSHTSRNIAYIDYSTFTCKSESACGL